MIEKPDILLKRTALYRHFSKGDDLLYVGIAVNPFIRMSNHDDESHWFEEVTNISIEWFDDRTTALTAEKAAILSENPKFNVVNKPHETTLSHVQRSKDFHRHQILTVNPTYTVSDFANAVSLPKAKILRLIESGLLNAWPTAKGGKSWRLSGWSLLEFIEHLDADGGSGTLFEMDGVE